MVGKSAYGPVLFDGRGFALYAFTRDRRGRSTCSGACAGLATLRRERRACAPARARSARCSARLRRADGSRQVTYAGRPLYYYVGDRKAGQILCQNVSEFGGLWLVVRGSGRPVQ